MIATFTIGSDALPDSARVVSMLGAEGLSRLYEYQVTVASSATPALDELALAAASIDIEITGGDTRPLANGIVARAELLHREADWSLVRVTVVPKLWTTTLSRHSRVFTDQSIIDIIRQVLEDSGLASDAISFRTGEDHPVREHVCQYHESDYAFICRLMERDGLYFFFEPGDAGDTLVITDGGYSPETSPTAPVQFGVAEGADAAAAEGLWSFSPRRWHYTESVRVVDYDYLRPSAEVAGSATRPVGVGQIVRHGTHVLTKAAAGRAAEVDAEEIAAQSSSFQGEGSAFGLRSGFVFELEGHPMAELDGPYHATTVQHRVSQAGDLARPLQELIGLPATQGYQVCFEALATDVPYRPPRRHRWPRVPGLELAVVCGAADSEYAQLDEHGRYHVRFLFDENDNQDGQASTWIRMAQPHAGVPEGFHFPLRKGTEVLIEFAGADPDRPVISGALPNPQTPDPVTSNNHTQNVVQTGSHNRFEAEDLSDSQHIAISTPPESTFLHMGSARDGFNWVLHSSGRAHLDIGSDQTIDVGAELIETVQGAVAEDYRSSQSLTVLIDESRDYLANHSEHVHGSVTEHYDQTHDQTVLGYRERCVTGGDRLEILDGLTYTCDSGQSVTITGDSTSTISDNLDISISGTLSQTITGGATINATGDITIDTTGKFTMVAPAGCRITATGGHEAIAPGGNTTIDSFWDQFGLQQVLQAGQLIDICIAKIDMVAHKRLIVPIFRSSVYARLRCDVTTAKFGTGEILMLLASHYYNSISAVQMKQAVAQSDG